MSSNEYSRHITADNGQTKPADRRVSRHTSRRGIEIVGPTGQRREYVRRVSTVWSARSHGFWSQNKKQNRKRNAGSGRSIVQSVAQISAGSPKSDAGKIAEHLRHGKETALRSLESERAVHVSMSGRHVGRGAEHPNQLMTAMTMIMEEL
ncbi:hypothetical protein B0H13DRAFT_1908999 [Mycena leptocephala]|nr:hypothetical protein B0H13DRAFT_1908999 [Mycena leptocephala]